MDLMHNLRTTGRGGSLSPQQVESYDTEGYLVLKDLLDDEDLAPCRQAMDTRVQMIADELFRDGLIKDRYESEPFKTRLALLFHGLTDKDFLNMAEAGETGFPAISRLCPI